MGVQKFMKDLRNVQIYYNSVNVFIIPTRYCEGVGMVESEPYFICNFNDMNNFCLCLMEAYAVTEITIAEPPKNSILQKAVNLNG
ncbi:MAG: hypothetical protein Ta2B_16590 [Termitinemataceae bacterium]|nr:MAG: hypothetical protein Ta2B_16590 [Termitinemataceae bacterium]